MIEFSDKLNTVVSQVARIESALWNAEAEIKRSMQKFEVDAAEIEETVRGFVHHVEAADSAAVTLTSRDA